MTTSQDKAFRRISELKEQIQLDVLAKQHIEENYSLMLEEKGELVKVLHTQVSQLHCLVWTTGYSPPACEVLLFSPCLFGYLRYLLQF